MKSEHFNYASFRKNGKVHRGIVHKKDGYLAVSCNCPGSQNGSLSRNASILCVDEDSEIGWKLSNCGRKS